MTYYDVLGVPRNASTAEITRAFRRLAATHHPDVTGIERDNPAYAEVIQPYHEALAAYETLKDPTRRRRYDLLHEPIALVATLFQSPVGQRLVAAMLPSAPKAPRPGADTAAVVTVDAATLANGGIVEVIVPGSGELKTPVTVPPDAAILRFGTLRGAGEAGRNGADSGDHLVILVRQRE